MFCFHLVRVLRFVCCFYGFPFLPPKYASRLINADIKVIEYVSTVDYDYEKFHLTMHTYLCELLDKSPEFVYHDNENLEHENMVWLDLNDLDHLDWLPADILVVEDLKKNKTLKLMMK